MSLSYGFYDSVNHDRTYNAEQFGKMFDGVILDGIFPQIGSAFAVTATSGLNFSVATGRAWFDHTWSLLEAAETMSVSTPDLDNPRIDTVVIEINKTSRTNSLAVVTGTPSSNPVHPELAHTEYVHQYPLADIYVPARATNLGAVTDRRGTNDCPYVRIVTDIAGRYVTSLNGETGDVTGVKSFNGQTGVVTGVSSVNGQTGIVTLVTGVSSVNGQTGAVSIPSGIAYRDGLDAEGDPTHDFRFQFNDLTKRVNDRGRYEYVIETGIQNIKAIHVWNNSKLNVGAGYSDIPASQNLHMDGYDIIVRKLDSDSYMFEVFAIVGSTKGYSNKRAEGISRFITSERLSRCDLNHTHGVGLLSSSQKSSSTSWVGYIGWSELNAGGELNRLEFIYWDDSGNVHFIFDSNEDVYGYCSMSGRMEVLD